MTNHLAIRPVELSPSKALAAESVRARATRVEDIHAVAPKEPEAIASAGGDNDSDDSHETSAKGVIRLLESGHFRSVADVRLRINFHDELEARREEAARPVIEHATETFTNTVSDGVNDVVASLGLEDAVVEEIGAFTDSINTALADFSSDAAAVEQSLRDAFGELLVSLQASYESEAPAGSADEAPPADAAPVPIDPAIVDVTGRQAAITVATISSATPVTVDAALQTSIAAITPIAIDGPADTGVTPIAIGDVTDTPEATDVPNVAPADPETTTGETDDVVTDSTLDEALATLQDLFETALTSLLNELDTATALPELSEPHGNGTAYDKFLAQYLDLVGAHDSINTIA